MTRSSINSPPDRTAAVIAVDLGGTTIKAALVGSSGATDFVRMPSGADGEPTDVFSDVTALVKELTSRAAASERNVAATAIVVPGIVDESRGVAVHSATFRWHNLDAASWLRERLDAVGVIVVHHDVRAAARAEALFGAAAGASIACCLPIGTGIAATTIVGGRVLDGASNSAGEVGQQLVADPDRPGAVAPMEQVASARAIARRYGVEGVDAREVASRAADGDATAARIWNSALAALADVLAGVVNTVDPAVVVLGGGLSLAGDRVVEPLRDLLGERLAWRSVPDIRVGAYGFDAGIVGAAIDAWTAAAGDPRRDLADAIAPARWRQARLEHPETALQPRR